MARMRSWFSGLQVRLVLGFTAVLAIALAGVGIYIGLAADREVAHFDNRQEDVLAARVSGAVSKFYSDRRSWVDLQSLVREAGAVTGRHIMVTNPDGIVVADSRGVIRGLRQLTDVPALRDGRGGNHKNGKEARLVPLYFDDRQVGGLFIGPRPAEPGGIPDPTSASVVSAVNRSLLWTGLAAAAIGTLLVWMWSRRLLTPLKTLGAAALRLGQGDLAQRAPTEGPSEIRQLAQSFNVMAEGLEDAERQRRNLTADVAHELRTPLSNIQGYLEAIRDGLVDPTPETIDTIHGQSLHLSRLVEDLRLLAQVEAGALQLQLSPTGMEELLQSSVEAVRPRADAKRIDLTLDLEPSLPTADLDTTRISQVIGNLLENAITHTPEGGRVTVSGRAADSIIAVTVSDTGPGIAPEELPRIFDRFYRADPSRDRSTGGAGLGLTIARRLAEAHGGTIEAESALGEGSRFTVRLPAVQ